MSPRPVPRLSPDSNFGRCPTCGQYDWLSRHTCPPLFEFRCDDWHGEDGWNEIHARDAKEAAEKATELYDADEHPLLRGQRHNYVVVHVRDPRTNEVTMWQGTAEQTIVYHAERIEAEDRP